MKNKPPTLLPILKSDVQGRILSVPYLNPGSEYSLTDLARLSKTSIPTVMREIDRVVIAGFLLERRIGPTRLVRVDAEHPTFQNLQALLIYGYGPKLVLERQFAGLNGILEAYIYGSWAARYQGVAGPDPTDVDLLIIGDVDRAKAANLGVRASQELGREVSVNNLSVENWKSAESYFVKTLRSRPLVRLEFLDDLS